MWKCEVVEANELHSVGQTQENRYFFSGTAIIAVFTILPLSRTISFHTTFLISSVVLHQPYPKGPAPGGVSTHHET